MSLRSPKTAVCGWEWKPASLCHSGFPDAHTRGMFAHFLWGQGSGSSSRFPAAVHFHFAKRFLTDEGRAERRLALVVFRSSLCPWVLWGRIRQWRVGKGEASEPQPDSDPPTVFKCLPHATHWIGSLAQSRCIYWVPILGQVPAWLFNIN